MRRRLLSTSIALLVLTGCAIGPNYKRPQVALPDQFRNGPAPSVTSLADTKWQELFHDPVLNQIVTTALEKNFDLRIAAERVQEAHQQLGVTKANQYPFLDLQTSFTAVRPSTLGGTTFIKPGTNLSAAYTTVGAALSWEVDLWGRLRRLTEAARAQYLASQEGRNAVTVSLVSDVMNAYLQLLEQDLELDISRRTTGLSAEGVQLVELRRNNGAASGLDVSQAQQLQFAAAAQVAAAQRNIAQTENTLSFLQGSIPAAQQRGRKLEDIAVPAQAPPGLPSALLERRPDIRQAEQNLIAANAQIGAAKALYFPQISLSAFAGGQSRELLSIATTHARDYSVTPSAVQSIFHAGQIRSQVRLTESQEREMLIDYQKIIYTALRETSDALVAFDQNREQRSQEEQLVSTLQTTVRLSELRYRGGLDSYLQVLDAQRALFAGELTLAQLRLQERLAVVQLYRALGGGWS
jgi:NodT family efflux transporter outer membrane factor (OMF) lipoprotein